MLVSLCDKGHRLRVPERLLASLDRAQYGGVLFLLRATTQYHFFQEVEKMKKAILVVVGGLILRRVKQ